MKKKRKERKTNHIYQEKNELASHEVTFHAQQTPNAYQTKARDVTQDIMYQIISSHDVDDVVVVVVVVVVVRTCCCRVSCF